MGFPDGASGKETPANAVDIGDVGSVPGSGISPEGGHGNPPQYSCLENSVDRGAWEATVHGVAKSQTRMKQLNNKQIEELLATKRPTRRTCLAKQS